FDEEWQEVGTRRTAYYTKLSPGNYTFRVNACNNDGIWSEEDISLSLYLEPYFYQTQWFYLFCGCGILLLIFGIYGLRVRQLKKYKEELRMLVARRTQQLEESNSSLAQSNQQTAEAVNRSKGEFLALMSHEIRTPMNGIIGFTDMLLETQLTDEQQDYAGTISRSGEALTTLLNDILDFSRIEAGELVLNPIDFDPELTVFDIFQLVLPAIGDKHLEVICHIGDSVPAYVRSDAGRYRQVLFNLMTNAVKFTEAGEIILSLDVEEEQKERLKLHVKLEDTGIGIPGDKLEAIFDVFQQGDGSTTRKFGGTGLGLSICKKIACLLGGDVWAESTHGKGSIFHFTAWVEKSLPSPEKVFHQVSLIGKKVLLLDDNHNYLAILSHLLELSQMNVVQLLNPTQAVPVILEHSQKGEPFDLGIIDILMPEMSGFEVAKAVRALAPPVGNMPLLGFSSSTMTSSIKYREAGFNGFLPKPIRRRKLLMVVERLLGIKEEGSNDIVTRHSIDEDVKHSIHILLAEDNPINRKLTEFMLTKAGYRLTMVENGEEAVRVFTVSPERFDLIFMDIQMPLLNGLEATRQIRDKGFGEVPIIAMTAQSMKGDREKCIDAGMDDYISKPVKREKVLKMIKKWCMGPAE
ncbi:MAG: response regulator, partial [bacterium]|nr:response regulator [bacterium]